MMNFPEIIEREPDAKDVLYAAYSAIVDDTAAFLKGMMKEIDNDPEEYKSWDVGKFLDEFRHGWCGK